MARKSALALLAAVSAAYAQCNNAQVDELVGYGADTTGGSGNPVVVSDCGALENALSAGGVIHIDGIIDGCDILRVPSDTTVQGVGAGSGLTGGGFRMYKVDNVILRNLQLSQAPQGGDLIDIETSTNIWVDHCDLSNDGIVGDKDHYDGLLDIKRASDWITVSWTKFHDHWKGTLIGHSGSNGDQDAGTMHVTYHHNSFVNVNSRLPSIRFGTGHIYSSCYIDNPTSGINSRENAQVLVESSYFENTRRAIVTDLDANDPGYAVERDNIFVNSDVEITQEGSLDVPYSYTVDPADCVCAAIEANGGTGVVA
ncbi:polysaccharide lyase family 1 protein [Sodiomyces alcalophilus JCM 7366]|uniref:polysaccharide lyase family 1 protein n=1 Tax=Sodiomyces alcalophilus JCM 7366 TaxID=591952 RepID=UPI0039B626FA